MRTLDPDRRQLGPSHPRLAADRWWMAPSWPPRQAAARLAHPDHPITIEAVGPLLVRADPLAISRILGNLLDNAAAYSPQGAGIRLSASRDGRHAVFAVQDQGPGVPPADRAGSSSGTPA